MKIAIVGSEEKYWMEGQRERVKEKIRHIFMRYADDPIQRRFVYERLILVSGHCPKGGVDIWAEEVAEELDIKMDIKKPQINRWNDSVREFTIDSPGGYFPEGRLKGYRSRNIDIATDCDVLYCIEPYRDNREGYRRSGGIWTLEYAKKLNKETYVEVIR